MGAPPFHQVSEVGEVGGEPWRLADRLLSGERKRGQCRHPGSPRRTPARPGGVKTVLGVLRQRCHDQGFLDGARVEAIVLFHVHGGAAGDRARRRQFWSLLSSLSLGRFVTCLDGRPEIFPVNFVTQRPTVLFRTAEGTKLFGAATHPFVAFEADYHDAELTYGWSVIVKGRAHVLSTGAEVGEAERRTCGRGPRRRSFATCGSTPRRSPVAGSSSAQNLTTQSSTTEAPLADPTLLGTHTVDRSAGPSQRRPQPRRPAPRRSSPHPIANALRSPQTDDQHGPGVPPRRQPVGIICCRVVGRWLVRHRDNRHGCDVCCPGITRSRPGAGRKL